MKYCLVLPFLLTTPFLMAFNALALPYLFNFISIPFPSQILLPVRAEISCAYSDPNLAFCLEPSFFLFSSY